MNTAICTSYGAKNCKSVIVNLFKRIKTIQIKFLKDRLYSPFERAKLVARFTAFSALVYHVLIFLTFFALEIYPMFYYNFISITVFSCIFFHLPKAKSFVPSYMIAVIEVIIHQLLADYFMGTSSSFHFFILLMGLLPFLIFEGRFNLSVPITIVTTLLFVFMEGITITPKYEINPTVLHIIRLFNVTITVFVILFMVMIYTIIVFRIEQNLERQNDNLEKEIKMAALIQQNFFKHDIGVLKNWDMEYFSKPMVGVSGDLYDFYTSEGELKGLGIFDVSGHGISSGLVTMLVKNIIFQEFTKTTTDELWEVVNRINDRVIEEKGDIANYLTGILARIKGNNLEYVNAGHPSPVYYSKVHHNCVYLEKAKTAKGAIGLAGFPAFYESQFLELEKDDELVFYSDGVLDSVNEEGVSFGKERLRQCIKEVADMSAREQILQITSRIFEFCGTKKQSDDITIIILKRTVANEK